MELIDAIDVSTAKTYKSERRCYIGASNVGNPCHAFLQYSLRGYPQNPPPPAVMRIFALGHQLEEVVVHDMKMAGINVSEVDPKTKQQWTYTALGGHLRGHADGIIYNGDRTLVLEIKSMNDKKWRMFKNQGISASHPIYYDQMQLLMGLSGLKFAWMVAYNKNTSVYHAQNVPFNEPRFKDLMRKSISVVRGASTTRISDTPDCFECRYCNYKPHCWPSGEQPLPLAVECRTCRHAKPTAKRKWFCTLHKSRATDPCSQWSKLQPEEASHG